MIVVNEVLMSEDNQIPHDGETIVERMKRRVEYPLQEFMADTVAVADYAKRHAGGDPCMGLDLADDYGGVERLSFTDDPLNWMAKWFGEKYAGEKRSMRFGIFMAITTFVAACWKDFASAGLVVESGDQFGIHPRIYELLLALSPNDIMRRERGVLKDVLRDFRSNPDAWRFDGFALPAQDVNALGPQAPRRLRIPPLHSIPAPGRSLLYDAIRDEMHMRHADAELLRTVGRIPIYELSNVVPLLSDWETERARPVPKRPPHGNLWCEWKVLSAPGFDVNCAISVGTFVSRDDSLIPYMTASPAFSEYVGKTPPHAAANPIEELYLLTHFVRIDRYSGPPSPVPQGKIFQLARIHFAIMTASSTIADVLMLPEPVHGKCTFPFDLIEMDGLDAAGPCLPIMAFGLLHCRNVNPISLPPAPVKNPERRAKFGLPPRRSHWVLSIDVPSARNLAAQPNAGGTHATPRLHIVRGNFAHLQDERFVHKRGEWIWREAHLRGDPERGEIDKTYSVESK